MNYIHEERKKFVIFLTNLFGCTLRPQDVSDFYDTGLMSTEWLRTLFALITSEQYTYVSDMLVKMYGRPIDTMASTPKMHIPKIRVAPKPIVTPEFEKPHLTDEIPAISQSEESRAFLGILLTRIYEKAHQNALHPSGYHVDAHRLQRNILHILPGHMITVSTVDHSLTLTDQKLGHILTQKLPQISPRVHASA